MWQQNLSQTVSYSYVVCGTLNDTLEYLAEESSKQRVKDTVWSLLAAYSKMLEERDRLREELLSKKGLGFDDLGSSQPIQIKKDAKIRKFTVRKSWV